METPVQLLAEAESIIARSFTFLHHDHYCVQCRRAVGSYLVVNKGAPTPPDQSCERHRFLKKLIAKAEKAND